MAMREGECEQGVRWRLFPRIHVSTYPRIHVSTYPRIHVSTYPRIPLW